MGNRRTVPGGNSAAICNLQRDTMKIAISLALILCSVTCYADPPVWFDANNLRFWFEGSMGGGDIDRVVPSAEQELGSLAPGTEWYARVDQPTPGIVLSSWQHYTPASDSFAGLLASNAGATSEELNGVVQPDGAIYLCISQTGNEQCVLGGTGFGNFNVYQFSLAVKGVAGHPASFFSGGTSPVPEPSVLTLSLLLLGLGWIVRRKP